MKAQKANMKGNAGPQGQNERRMKAQKAKMKGNESPKGSKTHIFLSTFSGPSPALSGPGPEKFSPETPEKSERGRRKYLGKSVFWSFLSPFVFARTDTNATSFSPPQHNTIYL